MRRSTLTFGLGITAVAAVAVAPRLSGLVAARPAPVVVSEVVAIPAESIPAELLDPIHAPTAVVPEVTARPRPVAQRRPRPSPVIEMKTTSTAESAIPELGEPRPRPVIPPAQPIEIDVDYWDGCPACGMG